MPPSTRAGKPRRPSHSPVKSRNRATIHTTEEVHERIQLTTMNPTLMHRPIISLPVPRESEYCELIFVFMLLIVFGCTFVYNMDMETFGFSPVKHKPQSMFDNPFTVIGFLKRIFTLIAD